MTEDYRAALDEALDESTDLAVVLAIAFLIGDKCSRLGVDHGGLSRVEQIPLHLNWIDSEVANGGFEQFLTNPTGQHASAVLESLVAIGAHSTAGLLEQALSVFPGGRPPLDDEERFQVVARAGDAARALLFDLDEQYYNQQEDIFSLGARHLRDHRADLLRALNQR